MLNGQNGIKKLSIIDTSSFRTHVGGQVDINFDENNSQQNPFNIACDRIAQDLKLTGPV